MGYNVYVIDDADLMLREETQDTFTYRPSDCTIIGNNRVSAYMPSIRLPIEKGPREYPKCSKVSMMIMQDLDNIAEGNEEYSAHSREISRASLSQSPSDTILLPSVRTRSSYLSLHIWRKTVHFPTERLPPLCVLSTPRLRPYRVNILPGFQINCCLFFSHAEVFLTFQFY